MTAPRDWAAVTSRLRWERRAGDRLMPCFAERPSGVAEMVARAALECGEAEALVCGDRRLSWRELSDRANALAGGFARAGVVQGDRIAMVLGNSAAFVIVLFAAARLGAVAVPISTREQRAGVEYVIGDCQAAALFYEAACEGAVPGPAICDQLKLVIDTDSGAFQALLTGDPAPAVWSEEEDVAVILYTSGTTGRPKGAMLSNRSLTHSTLNYVFGMEMAPGGHILVMDDDGREVPCGEVGEIWIGGTMLALGYWGNPAATASEFIGGYWRSGDLGMMDAGGFVYVHDRKKDMINRGGYKIYSAEVESVLMAQTGVAEAAVVGRPCPVLGERVHAVVVLAPDALEITGRELRARLKIELADYKLPETWVVRRDPLPRNPNGKVLKRLLREGLEPYRHGQVGER